MITSTFLHKKICSGYLVSNRQNEVYSSKSIWCQRQVLDGSNFALTRDDHHLNKRHDGYNYWHYHIL